MLHEEKNNMAHVRQGLLLDKLTILFFFGSRSFLFLAPDPLTPNPFSF